MSNAEVSAGSTIGISPLAENHCPAYRRSKRVLERNADVFVWWPTNTLIACFNAQIIPVTPETLLRWIGMPAGLISNSQIVVKHVRLEHRGIFDYRVYPLEAVPSSKNLSAGVYGCFFEGQPDPTSIPKDIKPMLPAINTRSFKQIRSDHDGYFRDNLPSADAKVRIEQYSSKHYSIPDDLRDKVSVPHDECIFTGYPRKATTSDTSAEPMSAATTPGHTSNAASESTSSISSAAAGPVELYWIFPRRMGGENGVRDVTLEECRTPNNILPMGSNVHELWFANELSVDADDRYRIRTFTEAAASLMASFPERLENPRPEWAFYFRLHLLHTCLLRFCGGDIYTEYGYRRIADFHALVADTGAVANREDPIWQTEMGKEYLGLLDTGKQVDTETIDDDDGASDGEDEF